MANANFAFGLRPIMDNGTPWSGQGRMVCFPSSQSSNIFLGDPIVAIGGTDANGVPLVGIATAGATNVVLGGFIGVCNGPAGGGASAQVGITQNSTVYRTGSVLNYGFVCDDPNQVYAIQEDSVGGAIAEATGGFANGNLVAGTGSTVTAFSGWQLQSSGVSSSANPTYQLRLLGLVRGPDNVVGVNAKWAVRLNLPQLWGLNGV